MRPQPDRLKIQNLTRGKPKSLPARKSPIPPPPATKACSGAPASPRGRLWIVPCASVHTFFMKFPIDLVYIDRRKKVKKVRSRVGPWRLSACFSAHSILELPAGNGGKHTDSTAEINSTSHPRFHPMSADYFGLHRCFITEQIAPQPYIAGDICPPYCKQLFTPNFPEPPPFPFIFNHLSYRPIGHYLLYAR